MKTKKLTPAAPVDGATSDAFRGQAKAIQKVCEADTKRFQTETPTAKLIGRAYFYWTAYPLLLNMMGFQSDGWDKAENYPATWALDNAHYHATRVLTAAVGQLGIDSSPLYAASRLCRELHHSDFWRVFPLGRQYDYWPESLGSALLELPPDQRQTILTAHGIVRRLEIATDRVDLGAERPEEADATGGQVANRHKKAASKGNGLDTVSKIRKKRDPDRHSKACITKFKEYVRHGDQQSMKYVVREYCSENPGVSFSGTYQRCSDHSDKWKK